MVFAVLLCRLWFCMLMIVWDDKRNVLRHEEQPSSSCGIFGNLCDGRVDPPQMSRTLVYQNTMVYSG